MPDKTHYSRVSPAEIPALIDKHCKVSPASQADVVEATGVMTAIA
jgi:(2Fe-2S) ferredoxin